MKTLFGSLLMFAALVALPVKAAAEEADRTPASTSAQATPRATPEPAEPPTPPPSTQPTPPPSEPPPPPRQEKPLDSGQWVYTEQYGWVWMPYGDRYTHLPPDGGTPHMYVYYPESGWSWVVAPWLWGWGPSPYFGVFGPRYYAWWGIGLGRWHGFAGPYAHWGWSGRAYGHGSRWNGVGRGHGGYGHGVPFRGFSGPSRGLAPGWRR